MVASANNLIVSVLGAIPDPGQGKAPPGSEGANTVLSWLAWGIFVLCVAGVLITAGTMAVSSRRGHGGGGEHMAALGWVCAACVIAGSASGLVGALA